MRSCPRHALREWPVGVQRCVLAVVAAVALIALGGCEATPPVAAVAPPALATADPVLRLQAGDRLRVTVFGEDKLSGDFDVDAGGSISLPLAGTVKAAGMSKADLERELTRRYRGDYLRNPRVTVELASARPFYVLGEVQKPGEYVFKAGLNAMSAIAVAGGQTYRASTSRVLIQRAGEPTFTELPLSPATPVYPGDLVRVPERYF